LWEWSWEGYQTPKRVFTHRDFLWLCDSSPGRHVVHAWAYSTHKLLLLGPAMESRSEIALGTLGPETRPKGCVASAGVAAVWFERWGSAGNQLFVVNLETRQPIALGDAPPEVTTVAISRDGQFIASQFDRDVAWWDVSRPGERHMVHADTHISSLTFHSDGRSLLLGLDSGVIQVFSLDGRAARVPPILVANDRVTSIRVAPDGQQLAAAAGRAFVWQYSQLHDRPREFAGSHSVREAFFSADRTHLVTLVDVAHPLGYTNAVEVWDLRLERLADGICDLVNRDLTEREWAEHVGPRVAQVHVCPGTNGAPSAR
jgi:WD40 repeat protein